MVDQHSFSAQTSSPRYHPISSRPSLLQTSIPHLSYRYPTSTLSFTLNTFNMGFWTKSKANTSAETSSSGNKASKQDSQHSSPWWRSNTALTVTGLSLAAAGLYTVYSCYSQSSTLASYSSATQSLQVALLIQVVRDLMLPTLLSVNHPPPPLSATYCQVPLLASYQLFPALEI